MKYFDYLHYRFDVTKAKTLTNNYQSALEDPHWKWFTPFTLTQGSFDDPVILATIVLEKIAYRILIHGHRSVIFALEEGEQVKTVTLNLKDTLGILVTHRNHLTTMRKEGKELGLL